jgi:hypothetical protein
MQKHNQKPARIFTRNMEEKEEEWGQTSPESRADQTQGNELPANHVRCGTDLNMNSTDGHDYLKAGTGFICDG